MSNNIHNQEEEGFATSDKITLWNPNVAAIWSLLLSPFFGSWLIAKNWNTLENSQRCRQAKYWGWMYIPVLAASFFITDQMIALVWNFVILLFMIVWYFQVVRSQVQHLKENYPEQYIKKGWVAPVGKFIGSLFVIAFVIGISAAFILDLNDDKPTLESQLSDLQGIWKLDDKYGGTLVTLNVIGGQKTITIGKDTGQLKVASFENAPSEKIIFQLLHSPSQTWAFSKVYSDNDSFHYIMEDHKAGRYTLSFVREFGSTPPKAKPKQPTSQSFKVKDRVKIGNIEWKITKVRAGKVFSGNYLQMQTGSDETILVWVFGQVTNRGTESETFVGGIELIDKAGIKYTESEDGIMIADTLILESFNPNVPKRFSVIFEVPKSAKGLSFLASDLGMWNPKFTKISLGLDK